MVGGGGVAAEMLDCGPFQNTELQCRRCFNRGNNAPALASFYPSVHASQVASLHRRIWIGPRFLPCNNGGVAKKPDFPTIEPCRCTPSIATDRFDKLRAGPHFAIGRHPKCSSIEIAPQGFRVRRREHVCERPGSGKKESTTLRVRSITTQRLIGLRADRCRREDRRHRQQCCKKARHLQSLAHELVQDFRHFMGFCRSRPPSTLFRVIRAGGSARPKQPSAHIPAW